MFLVKPDMLDPLKGMAQGAESKSHLGVVARACNPGPGRRKQEAREPQLAWTLVQARVR